MGSNKANLTIITKHISTFRSVTYVNEEDTKKAEGLQIKPGTGGNMEKLLSLVGNTVVMLGFVNAGIADKMPMHIQEAFINGLMCEFDQADVRFLNSLKSYPLYIRFRKKCTVK